MYDYYESFVIPFLFLHSFYETHFFDSTNWFYSFNRLVLVVLLLLLLLVTSGIGVCIGIVTCLSQVKSFLTCTSLKCKKIFIFSNAFLYKNFVSRYNVNKESQSSTSLLLFFADINEQYKHLDVFSLSIWWNRNKKNNKFDTFNSSFDFLFGSWCIHYFSWFGFFMNFICF